MEGTIETQAIHHPASSWNSTHLQTNTSTARWSPQNPYRPSTDVLVGRLLPNRLDIFPAPSTLLCPFPLPSIWNYLRTNRSTHHLAPVVLQPVTSALQRDSCLGLEKCWAVVSQDLLKIRLWSISVLSVFLAFEDHCSEPHSNWHYFHVTQTIDSVHDCEKDSGEIKRVWKSVVAVEGACWSPMLVCVCWCSWLSLLVCVSFVVFPYCSGLHISFGSIRHNRSVAPNKIRNYIRWFILLCVVRVMITWLVVVPFVRPTVAILLFICGYSCNSVDFSPCHTHYDTQAQHRTRSMREVDVQLMPQLTDMLHEMKYYFQMFRGRRSCAFRDHATTTYQMIIFANGPYTSEHVRRYNRPTCAEEFEILPGSEYEKCGGETLRLVDLDSWMHSVMKFWICNQSAIMDMVHFVMSRYPEHRICRETWKTWIKISPTMLKL